MKLNEEIVNKISDDFQSTFSQINDNTLVNLFFEKECPVIENIIQKYIPNSEIQFMKGDEVVKDYFIWEIRILNKGDS